MTARASFRSQLLVGSVLWTVGLLIVVSVLAILLLAHNPRVHLAVYGWFLSAPAVLTLAIGLAGMAAGARQIRRSLAAVERLRARLGAVHRGEVPRVAGQYSAEVQPLVDDDGPGLDPSLASTVLQRGVRADERVPGSGLGLAIVRELVELYGGSITLARSPLGGLRAHLTLPAAGSNVVADR